MVGSSSVNTSLKARGIQCAEGIVNAANWLEQRVLIRG